MTKIADSSTSSPSSPFISFSYSRNADNEVSAVTSTGVPPEAASYSYSQLNELKQVNTSSYGYDAAGNLTNLISGATQGFNADDEVTNTGYSYNSLGERTSGLTATGTATYGYDQAGRLTQVSTTASSATQPIVAAGDYFSLAIKSDGTVWSWGDNHRGQLGNGTTTDSHIPVQVTGLASVVAVAANGSDSIALKSDGTVWDWGLNSSGQLGNGTTTDSDVPVQVSGLTGAAVAVAEGSGHALALKSDGTVWAWGLNSSGQLGIGNHTNHSTPVQVSTLTGVSAIAAGDYHSLALTSGGQLWAWGDNEDGALGNNSTSNALTPIQVSGMTGVVDFDGSDTSSIALKSNGTVWDWGNNASGQLGNGTTTNSLVPIQVTSLTGIMAVTAGGHNSMALKSDGTVWAWGDNSAGALGNNSTTNSSTPVQASGIVATGPIAICGDDDAHTLAVKSDGSVWAWGSNTNGQLGNNSTTNALTPIKSNMASVKSGGTQTISYSYNGDGLRTAKTVSGTTTPETWNVTAPTPLLLADGSTDYVYGLGGLPLEQISVSSTVFYYQDQLGSTRAMASVTGTVVATYTYDPYGNLTGSQVTGTVTNPFGFDGQYTDAESGLIYLRARFYDPATGQFVTQDPLAPLTGEPYGYAGDNPLNNADPTGLVTVAVRGGVGAAIGAIVGLAGSGQFCLVRTLFQKNDQWGVEETYGVSNYAVGAAIGGQVTYQISTAVNIHDLAGPFTEVAASGKIGIGLAGDVFCGRARNGTEVVGGDFGLGFGPGAVVDVLHTQTYVQQANSWYTKLALEALWNSLAPSNLVINGLESSLNQIRNQTGG